MSISYPPARRGDIVDVMHGVRVPDPYRWLEDPDSAETRAWVDAQNTITRSVLDGDARDRLVRSLVPAFNVPRSASPVTRDGRHFFLYNSGLQNQAVLYLRAERGAAVPLIDPNTWSADGTTALTGFFPSCEGRLVAYAMSHRGSDRQQIRIRDADSRCDRADTLEWVKFASLAWTPGGDSFYYLRFPTPGTVAPEDEQYFGRIYLHVLDTPQSDDPLVFEYPSQKEVVPLVDVTDDGKLVVITCQRGASDDAEVYLIEVRGSRSEARPLFTGFDAAYAYVGSRDGQLLFRTTKDAPMGRVITVASDGTVIDLVPESADRLVDAVITRDTLAAVYLHNASSELRLFERTGELHGSVTLPGLGTITTIDADSCGDDVVFAYTSFTQPSTAYVLPPTAPHGLRLEPEDSLRQREHSLRQLEDPAPQSQRSVTSQVWYTSRDGTRVSMFLVHRPDLPRNGVRPVLLSGYGGFNISRTPQFDPAIMAIVERGGIFALANLRGGGEYGEAWHRAGMLERKQNVFDDFIGAAEFLICEGYTSPKHLAIEGGSNGGLLVGAVMIQRPDLFGAVVCRVPVADMLRYHLFTVGRFWIPEYGSADDPAQFAYLLRYSPYHNVKRGTVYPPTLVMTAETDDRVDPGMAKKFAARLQAEGAGGPFLLRVETKAGHGAGKPVGKLIEEDADILAFLALHI